MPTPTRILDITGTLAFGSVAVGASAATTITLTNSGNATLTVTGTTVPNVGIYSANWTKGTISAGGSQPVTVTFAPTFAQTYLGTVTFAGDQTSGTNTIAISGTGIATK
jgi:hypothetical protein